MTQVDPKTQQEQLKASVTSFLRDIANQIEHGGRVYELIIEAPPNTVCFDGIAGRPVDSGDRRLTLTYWVDPKVDGLKGTTAVIAPLYEDDPEIAAMTEEELTKAALALFGSWADREDLKWMDNLRKNWSDEEESKE